MSEAMFNFKLTLNFNVLCILAVFYTTLAREYIVDIPNQGKIRGVEFTKSRIKKIIAYYGIPYAKPPIGLLRFSPPDTNPLPNWDDVKNNTDYQPSCLQGEEDYKTTEVPFLRLLADIEFPSNISEDCLYLNVFVPNSDAPLQGFAVIIWFHPGNFTTGLPSIWDPHTLVHRQRLIVVTFAWRLNIMGFFTTMDGEAAGNYGLMDQQAAMQWVKNNIKLFGGNPDNISLMGSGTGAISIGIQMIHPESRPLFNKAIIMSGSFFETSAVRYPEEDKPIIDRLSKDFGCIREPTSKQLIDCLRHVDGSLLVQQTATVNWRPLIDKDLFNNSSPFLPKPPLEVFKLGDYAKIPILTGYTNMEQALEFNVSDTMMYSQDSLRQALMELISGDIPNENDTDISCSYIHDHLIDSVMFFYAPTIPKYDSNTYRNIAINSLLEKTYASSTILLASYLSQDQPTYVYRFDMKPSTKIAVKGLASWISVPHLYDLLFIWGVPYWRQEQEWDPRDKRISDTVMSFWTNFAKFSDPTQNTIYPIKWDAFTKEKPGLLIIDNTIYMSNPSNVNYKAFEFWNDYYPKVVAFAKTCCGLSNSSASINFSLFLLLLIFVPIINEL